MNNLEISKGLQENHSLFVKFLKSLNEKDFEFGPSEKWNTSQQLGHIILSLQPLNKALLLPKFLLGWVFGKANRESKNYDELVNKYSNKLQTANAAPARFAPKKISFQEREFFIQKLEREVDRLINISKKFSETDLDKYILPHPLLGKITLREMMYFTMHHVRHHHDIAIKNLELK
jgi:hypothetical protein